MTTTMTRAELADVLGFAPSDEQWACISAPLEPFVIVAGAGTGKTTVMAARVLWLVASGLVRESEVLGLTFTNKAAAELAHRVSDLLERWRVRRRVAAVAESPPAGLGAAVARAAGDGSAQARTADHDSDGLRVADHDVDGLRVADHDVDGLRVADHDVDGLRVADHDADLGARAGNIAAPGLAGGRATSAAGAPHVDPEPADDGEPTIATYHSFARRLVDEQGLRVGMEPGARLLSPAAVAQLAYRLVCRSRALAVTTHGPAKVAADVVALDASLAEQTLTTDDVRAHCTAVLTDVATEARPGKRVGDVARTAARRLELLDLVDELRAAKGAAGGVDFSDHMRLCVDLVTRSPELVASLRTAYPLVLLDEYQDTSIAQRVILSTLFAGSAVTAVGDPLQAIYGWRSASVANIEAFGAHFGGPRGPAPTRALSVNRRSGDVILDAANEIGDELRAAHPHVLALRAPVPRQASVRAALLPTVLDEREWIADQIADLVRRGCPPGSIGVLGRTNDSLVPLHALLSARGIPASISGVAALESSPATLCVLSTLRLLADPADNAAAVALLAGPRWRLSPADIDALARRAAQLAPVGGVRRGDDSSELPLAARIAAAVLEPDQVELPSLVEAAADPGGEVSAVGVRRLQAFREELRWLHARANEPLPELVAHVLSLTGAHVEADLAQPAGGAGDVALAGLLSLVDGFSDVDGRTGVGAFLAHLESAELLGSAEEVPLPVLPGTVQLMTMHKAKGLEFPVVVLPHLSRGEFPSAKGMERWTTQAHVVPFELRDDRHVLPHLEQLRNRGLDRFIEGCRAHDRSGDDRLAYVAVTRAQDLLIASGHWWGATQANPRGPSPYLEILREHALRAAGSVGPAPPDASANRVAPSGPAARSAPAGPAEGSVPSDAANRVAPSGPAARSAPAGPAEGSAPSGPAAHSAPAGPAAHSAPAGPAEGPVPSDAADRPAADPGEPGDGSGCPRARAGDSPDRSPVGDPWTPAPEPDPSGAAPTNPVAALIPDLPWPPADLDPADPVATSASLVATLLASIPDDAEPPVAADLPASVAGWVRAEVAAWDAALEVVCAELDAEAEAAPVRLPGVLTASAALELVQDPAAFARQLVRPMPRPRNRHAELGTAFHAWVETRLGAQPLITDELLPGAADEGIASDAELAELKAAFERLPHADAAPTALEAPFAVSLGGLVVRGRIDAVFPALPDAPPGVLWDVVDWKTSRSDRADPLQLAIYRVAWAQQRGVPVDRVRASFVHVRSGHVEVPDHLPDADELIGLLSAPSPVSGTPSGVRDQGTPRRGRNGH